MSRTVTTAWCTELGTTLLNGFINTTDNPAYFRCLNSLSVHHPIRLRKFLFHWSRHAGAPLLSICETCKYIGADFLEFLRSGEKDIHAFADNRARAR